MPFITFIRNIFYNMGLLIFLVVLISSCNHSKSKYYGPLTPKKSIETFHFAEKFKAQLFASEPLVKNPVAMRFGDAGNVYVVELGAFNKPDSIKGRGRIVMLKDTNGDGRAEQSVLFAEDLTDPTSILPWKGGLIVTAAPDILYLKDTTGDGRADMREVLFSGFYSGIVERQISNLRFGVDNWIYVNNENNSGMVTYHRKPEAPKLSMRGADFRFRLDRNEFERTTGPGQFGQALDDWSHRFITKNSQHIRQVVIPERYLHRNLHLPSSTRRTLKNINNHGRRMYQLTPAPYWREVRTRRRNKKYQKHHLNRVEHAKNYFTGASGGIFYGGNGFPKKFYGSVFNGDVAGSLVHRDVLLPQDDEPFFIAKRGKKEQAQEFLASTDSWFRPVNFEVGPGGYLYVIDMYQQHIENEMDIPKDLKADMDFTNGDQRGRIYRIMYKGARSYRKKLFSLKDSTSLGLVKLLSNPNRWWRLYAHKILVERQDKSVIPAVKALFGHSKDPRARIQALYVLEGLDALNAKIVKQAMKDRAAGIRENGAILSERFPGLLPHLEKMIADSSMRVAFQATLSLGEFAGQSVASALASVVEQYGQNPWFRTAVLSSKPSSTLPLLKALTQKSSLFQKISFWKYTFLKESSYMIGNRNKQVMALLDLLSRFPLVETEKGQSACIRGLINGLEKSQRTSSTFKKSLQTIKMESSKNVKKAMGDLKQLYNHSPSK